MQALVLGKCDVGKVSWFFGVSKIQFMVTLRKSIPVILLNQDEFVDPAEAESKNWTSILNSLRHSNWSLNLTLLVFHKRSSYEGYQGQECSVSEYCRHQRKDICDRPCIISIDTKKKELIGNFKRDRKVLALISWNPLTTISGHSPMARFSFKESTMR